MTLKIKFVMFSITNIIMAIAMSLTVDIINNTLSYNTLLMILVGYLVGMILSFLIPWNRVSEFCCKLLKVNNPVLSIMVGSIIPSTVNTIIISFVMVFINVNPFKLGFEIFFNAYFGSLWILLIVSYIVSCFANPLSIYVASKMMKGDS